ncbi:hypothetical protein Ahy_B06g081030 [Arachis hypogaea]|uniref:CCHC-type domain-containing protein n=1 Tax=Arachis hypogaea TaxID=3818 RepID=A0A444YK18_ARAHY|nr:hypothetical protein Ahy_B06g081030 [Arachis hypogaea]
MLKIDRATSIHSRGRFARICVEIDLFKKLILRISVFSTTLNIEYERLHLICFPCGKYGHRSDQCSESLADGDVQQVSIAVDKQKAIRTDQIPKDNQGKNLGDSQFAPNQKVNHDPPDFGLYMMVKRQVRTKSVTGNKGNQAHKEDHSIMEGTISKEGGSRFEILNEEGKEDNHVVDVHENVSSNANMHVGPTIGEANQVQKETKHPNKIVKRAFQPGEGKNAQGAKKHV